MIKYKYSKTMWKGRVNPATNIKLVGWRSGGKREGGEDSERECCGKVKPEMSTIKILLKLLLDYPTKGW